MEKFDPQTKKLIARLQDARLALMKERPFYATLLLHMNFALDLDCETAYTDGNCIAFSPEFIENISDSELKFVLMHEVLHAVLGHPFRKQSDYDLKAFDLACDVIVNSNLFQEFDEDERKITLKNYGTAPHQMPDGSEGYLYSLEQAYQFFYEFLHPIDNANNTEKKKEGAEGEEEECSESAEGDANPKDDTEIQGDKASDSNESQDSNEGQEDEVSKDAEGGAKQKSGANGKKNKASNDGNANKGSNAPDDAEDAELDAKLNSLIQKLTQSNATHAEKHDLKQIDRQEQKKEFKDDHTYWRGDNQDNRNQAAWRERLINATDILRVIEKSRDCGNIPRAAQRYLDELLKPTLDWRAILQDFLQEEVCDYSFSPPDRRMEDCPFFLPDFNETETVTRNILFMIDTSASMSDDDICQCYSEIYGGIEQFNGKLTGLLGFFDAEVVKPTPFESIDEFLIIRPEGGGGTRFDIIFDYVREQMRDEPPSSIIILTDGCAPIPPESAADDIPVLWIINNENITPEWGRIARIKEK